VVKIILKHTVWLQELDLIDATEFFKNKCVRLNDKNIKQVIDFYNKERFERYGYMGILQAEYSYEYNVVINEWQRKLSIIRIDNDMVIVFIKFVNMFQHRYNRLEGTPISVSGNKTNEKLVFDKLISSGICQKVVTLDVEKFDMKIHKRHDYWNFYSDIKNNYLRMNSRWKTKKGITKLLDDNLMSWRIAGKSDVNKISNLCESFELWKKQVEKSKFLSKNLKDGIVNYDYWNDDSLRYYIFEYDGFAVGLVVFVIVNNEIAYQIMNKGISHMITDYSVPSYVKNRLGAYMHYITVNDLFELNVKHLYCGSALKNRKPTLKIFKSIMNDKSFGCNILKS